MHGEFDHEPQPYTITPWSICARSITSYRLLAASQFFDGAAWGVKSAFISDRINFVFNAVFDPLAFVDYDEGAVLLNAAGVKYPAIC